MIIEKPCSLYKKKLEIGIGFYNFDTKKTSNTFIDPKKVNEIILTRASNVSSHIFKLNPSLTIFLFNNGIPTHTIIPINNLPKILKNEILFTKLSKYKKRKLAWIFCKGVCKQRIKIISRMNETRKNKIVSQTLKKMRKFEKELINKKSREELMGIEGNITKLFYSCLSEFNTLFKIKRDRNKKDIVNCLMNLSHTIIRNKANARLIINGINPYHSFLHGQEGRNNLYLSWDFAEFWIPYSDKLIFYSLEKKIIKPTSINKEGKLTEQAKNQIVKLITNRITNKEIDNKIKEFIGYLKGENNFKWTF